MVPNHQPDYYMLQHVSLDYHKDNYNGGLLSPTKIRGSHRVRYHFPQPGWHGQVASVSHTSPRVGRYENPTGVEDKPRNTTRGTQSCIILYPFYLILLAISN